MNFNEDSYTVAESDGQISLSLRIKGQFFVPVWAIVEIIEGTATGGLCKACTRDKCCVTHVAYAWLIFVRAYYASIIQYT